MTLLDAAVEWGRAGYRVHPLRWDGTKRPLTKWLTAATTDADEIAAMWRRWPEALIAVRTGDGLVVVDDDRGLAEPDPSMRTRTATTTRPGGWHYYFTSDVPVRNSIGKVAPGIDIRGEHGYVVVPPSQGRDWVPGYWTIEPIPPVLLAAIERVTPREPKRGGPGFEIQEAVPVGERHGYLVRYAGWIVKELDIDDEATLYDNVFEHALMVCDPWDAHQMPEVRRNIRGIARWVLEAEHGRR